MATIGRPKKNNPYEKSDDGIAIVRIIIPECVNGTKHEKGKLRIRERLCILLGKARNGVYRC